MVLTLCYINFLSYDVTSNLHELKDCISEAEISNERWQSNTIQRINSFEGFDAHGFFTLGRPHLTAVVANFITYLVVLISFKESEDTASKNKWWRTSKLYYHTSIIVPIIIATSWHSITFLKSVDFKKTVAQSSFLSKVLSFPLKLKQSQQKWQHFWKKWGSCNCFERILERSQ